MSVAGKGLSLDPKIQELLGQVQRSLDELAMRYRAVGALPPDPPRTPLGDKLRSIATTLDALVALSKRG